MQLHPAGGSQGGVACRAGVDELRACKGRWQQALAAGQRADRRAGRADTAQQAWQSGERAGGREVGAHQTMAPNSTRERRQEGREAGLTR